MVISQDVEELLDVAAPGVDRAGCHKAVGLLAAAAVPEFPGLTANIDCVDLGADGLDGAVPGEPERVSKA